MDNPFTKAINALEKLEAKYGKEERKSKGFQEFLARSKHEGVVRVGQAVVQANNALNEGLDTQISNLATITDELVRVSRENNIQGGLVAPELRGILGEYQAAYVARVQEEAGRTLGSDTNALSSAMERINTALEKRPVTAQDYRDIEIASRPSLPDAQPTIIDAQEPSAPTKQERGKIGDAIAHIRERISHIVSHHTHGTTLDQRDIFENSGRDAAAGKNAIVPDEGQREK